jgi:hypothetical protein
MAAAAQRIADLEQQVADLAAEVRDLRVQAFIIKSLEDIWAGTPAAHSAAVPARRPRHLSVVGGGAS